MTVLPMSEANLQKAVDDLAATYRYKRLGVRKIKDARSGSWMTPWAVDGKGWPDRLYVKAPWMILVDFKATTGLTPEQIGWFEAMAEFPCCLTFTWRRADYDSGLIARVLNDPEDAAA